MAYYYDGVKCDTLAELNSLRQSRGAQPMVAAHSSRMGFIEHIDGTGDSDYAPGVTWDDIDRGTHSEFGPK
jgi:hypothetical protein